MTYLTTDPIEQLIPVSVTEIDGIAELTVSAMDATGLMSIWFIKRVWHWLDYKPAVSGDVPEDLESMLFTRTERELSLVNELRNAIKERFADSVSEYEVNQFIEGWQPAAFPEILDEI